MSKVWPQFPVKYVLIILLLDLLGWLFLCHGAESLSAPLILANDQVQSTWQVSDEKSVSGVLSQKHSGETVKLSEDLFQVLLADGTTLKSAEMTWVEAPRLELLEVRSKASRLAERLPGQQLVGRTGESGQEPAHYVACDCCGRVRTICARR